MISNLEMLRSMITAERDGLERELRSALNSLRNGVEQAVAALLEGQRIETYLVVNAGSLTADIARWNLLRQISPLLGEGES